MTTPPSSQSGRTAPVSDDCGFGREFRILKSREFELARRNGRVHRGRLLVVYGLARGECGHPRLGVSVSKRVGNAVVRNRIKRAIRESFRISKRDFPHGTDILVIARNAASGAGGGELGGELLALGRKLRQA